MNTIRAMDSYEKRIFKLSNGIRVLIIPSISKTLTHVSVNILLGEILEKLNEREMTHYAEHLLGRFTSKKYKDYKLIAKELSSRGAETNASVSEYQTTLYINGFYKDLAYYADLLSNVINGFHIEKSLINQEKQAVIREITKYASDPEYVFHTKICKFTYKKINQFKCDNQQSILNLKKYDEKDVYKYIHEKITNNNIVISVTCPSDKIKETEKIIKQYFSFIDKNQKSKPVAFSKQVKNIKNRQIIWVKNNNKVGNKVSGININMRVYDDIKHMSSFHIALMYFKEIFFNFETGVFYKKLRDTLGLVYYVRFNYFVPMAYPRMSIYDISTNVSAVNLTKTLKEIIGILENLDVTDKDIESARNRINRRESQKEINTFTSLNQHYMKFMIYNRPIMERSEIKKRILDIDKNVLKKEITRIKKKLLKKCLIFYYSSTNLNTKLKANINRKFKYNMCI